jgi:hypothetical protein
MGLVFRLVAGVGIGFLGVFSVFGCASTAPPPRLTERQDPIPGGEQYIPDLQWCHKSCDGDHSGWCGLCDQNYTGWRERPIQPELEAEKNALTDAAPQTRTSPVDAVTIDAELIEFLTDYPPPPIANPEARESVFGSFSTDTEGRLAITPANEIRNAENERYGWLMWVGPTSDFAQWTESVTGPDGVDWTDDSYTAISEDGRTATALNAMVPYRGFIYSQWAVEAGQVPGQYTAAVSLAGGRTETFSYSLGRPQDACPPMGVFFDFWLAKYDNSERDLKNLDVSERSMKQFAMRLVQHGFDIADLEDAYWRVGVVASHLSDRRDIAHGHIDMRPVADFQGKAQRYDHTTSSDEGTLEYGYLFVSTVSELDKNIQTVADEFAAKLIPHARHMCSDWWSGQLEEEARLEEIQAQLELEIIRVRERRAEQEKLLKLEVEQ